MPFLKLALGLLGVALLGSLGCTSREPVGPPAGAYSGASRSGLRVECPWTGTTHVLTSETHQPYHFSYSLTNTSQANRQLQLRTISCGCANVQVTSAAGTQSLVRGSVFAVAPGATATVTLAVRLAGKPIGLHTFTTEFQVTGPGFEDRLRLPEPRLEIRADVTTVPPVLSHEFRGEDEAAATKAVTLTAIQRLDAGAPPAEPRFGPLPRYITLISLQKLATTEAAPYRTTQWRATFTLAKPRADDYTVAHAITILFPGPPERRLTIPSVVSMPHGVEARPRSLTLRQGDGHKPPKGRLLLTATDGRPFAITRLGSRAGHYHAVALEGKTSLSHLVEVTPTTLADAAPDDLLDIETDHADTPALTVRLSRAP